MKIWSALIVLKMTHCLYLLNSSTVDVCKYSTALKPLHFNPHDIDIPSTLSV